MKIVDIHPEELIDKLSAGELTSAERERLDAHLAQCAGCRFELGARADFAREAPTFSARPQLTFADASGSTRLPAVGQRRQSPASASIRPRSRRRWRLVLLAAALVLCAGGATAAVVTGAVQVPPWLRWVPESRVSSGAASASAAKAATRAKRGASKPVTAIDTNQAQPVALGSATPNADSSAPAALSAELVPAAPPRSVPLARSSVAPAARVGVASEATLPSVSVPDGAQSAPVAAFPALASSAAAEQGDAAPAGVEPAAALFADANRARRDGNADRAVALYHSLQSRYPSSSESELSRALLAQLLLERGSPEAALAGFDRYLAESAPVLGAEALVGRARALEQLGKSSQAVVAWREVQTRFAGSVHARLAATRLAALGAR